MSGASPSYSSPPPGSQSNIPKNASIAPSQTSRRELALLEAAEYGQTGRAIRSIETGDVDVDFLESEGRSALHFAAEHGHREIVQALIRSKCDVDTSSKIHGTALCLASLNSHVDIVRDLLQAGADVNAPGGDLGSALHVTCRTGNMEIFDLLVQQGATIDSMRTMEIGLVNEKLKLPKITMHKGDNHAFARGQPIHRAASGGHLEIITKLLDLGVNVDALSDFWYCSTRSGSFDSAPDHGKYGGCTTLWLAACRGHADVVELLLQRGARVDVKPTAPEKRSTALGTAASLNHVRCMTILLDAGAKVNHSACGLTPLMMAAHAGQDDAAELLLKRGAHPTATTKSGMTALHFAKTPKAVGLLVEHGAVVDCAAGQFGTPLRVAASGENNADTVRELIELGADVNHKISPLSAAIQRKRLDSAMVLLQHGTNPKSLGLMQRSELKTMAESNPELKALLEKATKENRESGLLQRLVSRLKVTSSKAEDQSSTEDGPSSNSVRARRNGDHERKGDADEDTLCGESMMGETKEVAQLKL